jgi:hypothetical protein
VRRLRKFALWLAAPLILFAVLCAIPIATVEMRCTATPQARAAGRTFAIAAPNYRRAEGDSYLTFPEWYIVYAYDDLAGVTRASSESSFDYIDSIRGFWTSLCGSTIAAGRVGPVTRDQRITNYIIGISFTAEMAIKGLWERTIGALAVLARGKDRTPEDAFALRLLDDYSAFLRQTPWYQYPFGAELVRFWRETPLTGGNPVRKVERRIALSLEWGVKAVYAKAIGWLAGYSPADLRIMSVVGGLNAADLAADRRIVKVADLGDGFVLIDTPRYQEFTEIARGLGSRGRTLAEIAGNRRILATVLTRAQNPVEAAGSREIFSLAIQSRPGWRRVGLDVDVPQLTRVIAAVETNAAVFEHAYDY